MRIIKLFLILCLFAGCATMRTNQQEPVRNYPAFVCDGAIAAAFKIQADFEGTPINAVLLLSQKQDGTQIKIIGDFATVILDAKLQDGQIKYNYVLNDMLNKKAQTAFSDILKMLLLPPVNFANYTAVADGGQQINYRVGRYIHRYHFKKGLSYPYKLEQIKGIVRKLIVYEDYQINNHRPLPTHITLQDGLGFFKVRLVLLSAK